MTSKQQHLSCVARGNGFVPVDQATFFIDNEPVHTGLFEEIGGSLQPVHNTDTTKRVRTCVLRQRHPLVANDDVYRAIEEMLAPSEPEARYVGIFEPYTERVKNGPSMPVTLTYYRPIHVCRVEVGPDQYFGFAARLAKRMGRPEAAAA